METVPTSFMCLFVFFFFLFFLLNQQDVSSEPTRDNFPLGLMDHELSPGRRIFIYFFIFYMG